MAGPLAGEQFETQSTKSNMSLKKEVTRGVFDPRTYREDDPVNWARKRRSDWLAVPGKIHYVRERTVASEEREMQKQQEEEERRKEEEEETVKAPPSSVKQSEPLAESKKQKEFWPRKRRSDITMSRVI